MVRFMRYIKRVFLATVHSKSLCNVIVYYPKQCAIMSSDWYPSVVDNVLHHSENVGNGTESRVVLFHFVGDHLFTNPM